MPDFDAKKLEQQGDHGPSWPDDEEVLNLLNLGVGDASVTVVCDVSQTGMSSSIERSGKTEDSPTDIWIGGYRLLKQIGEGGFGIVWRAEQMKPIHREVALKVIKPGMDSSEVIARFEAERQALAMMDHANIAGVLDAGTTRAERPYFVMDLFEGAPITHFCDVRKLTIRQRLELFIPVCEAVQHAHQKAILHRDLKPSNILVREVNGKTLCKVIDFGLAKALGISDEPVFGSELLRTHAGILMGTPQYMSPEQAGLDKVDVDTRSDIYSLGVILHELLTGQTPIAKESLEHAPYDEMLRRIRDHVSGMPSKRFSKINQDTHALAAVRNSDITKLKRDLSGELDWIVLKALEKDRDRRYPTAIALAEDIQHYLDGDPVNAAPPSRVYYVKTLLRRHRIAVGAATVVALALITGTALATWGYLEEKKALIRVEEARIEAEIARTAAQSEAKRSKKVEAFVTSMLGDVSPSLSRGRDSSALRDLLLQADERRKQELMNDPVVNAKVAYALATSMRQMGLVGLKLKMYEQALELLKQAGMGDCREVANCYQEIGSSRNNVILSPGYVGDRKEARAESLKCFQEALRIRRKLLPVGHPDLIGSLISCGKALGEEGRHEEARKVLDEAGDMARANPNPVAMSWVLEARGVDAINEGNLTLAESLFNESLGIRIKLPKGEDYSKEQSLANCYRYLASIYLNQKKFDEAEKAAQQVLIYRKAFLGHDSSGGLRTLATIYRRKKEFDRSEATLISALEVAATQERRPFDASLVRDLVNLRLQMKNREGAESLLKDAVATLEKLADANEDDLAFAKSELEHLLSESD